MTTDIDNELIEERAASSKWPFVAALFAIIGIADSIYLAVHHYTAEPVPCGITGGCETVLTSSYAEISGIPIAAFGALAYFAAFSFAILAAFGNRVMWTLFGLQATAMAKGVPQADGSFAPEPMMDVQAVADAVVFMAGLPLSANVQFMTVMATKMPFIGRG